MHHWRVLLDLDGTVAQNAGRSIAAEQFGIDLNPSGEQPRSLQEILGWTETEFWAWWHENQGEIYEQAVPITGAVETVSALKGAGAYIAIVTARRPDAEAVTTQWLNHVGLAFDQMVMGADDKATVAVALGLNVGFEDDPAHALALAEVMPVVLLDNLKNQGLDIAHPRVFRISRWTEALPLLQRLGEQTA